MEFQPLPGNTSPNFAATVQYTVYGDDGTELDPLLNGAVTLGPTASTVIDSPQPPALRTGWVKVQSSEPLQATVIFRSAVAEPAGSGSHGAGAGVDDGDGGSL